MQAQDEAIELLEWGREQCSALWHISSLSGEKPENAQAHEIRLKQFDQALAKLKEEPEQGEFTKNIMANLERWDSDLSDARIKSVIAWLKEVCRRYDWLVKRNAKLHEIDPTAKCADCIYLRAYLEADGEIVNMYIEKEVALEKIITKLHTESHEKDRTISQLRRQKTSIISQLNQQIDQLHAEIKKLVEGQKG